MTFLYVCLGIIVLAIVYGVWKTASSTESKYEYFEEQLTKVLSLLHQYDSMSDVTGIERNKYLFMAFHLYLTNILTSSKAQTMNVYNDLNIIENGQQKITTFYQATQVLQPAIQHRIERLPSDIKMDLLRKVYIDNNNVVHTEVHLLNDMRCWYDQIDFNTLRQNDYGNDLFYNMEIL